MTDSSNSYRLPIHPYLENSTRWWIDSTPQEQWHEHDTRYKMYQEWMKDQGVIIKSVLTVTEELQKGILDQPLFTDELSLDFVDEESMLVFILRWGN